MQGTLEWAHNRLVHNFVSGTTVQSICDEHPFKNSDDMFNELCGLRPHFTGNELSRMGQTMESVIIKQYEDVTGATVTVNLPFLVHHMHERIGVSPDGVVAGHVPRPVEIKYAAQRRIIPGLIPLYYSGQLQLTMAVFDVPEMDFVQMDSTGFLDIIPVYRDLNYLRDRLPRINSFIARVDSYREKNTNWLTSYHSWA